MRRLTALIKKIVPFPPEIQQEFFKIVKVLNLQPGEWIPDDLPTGTSIFVEEGFLLLTRYKDNHWKCTKVYCEGTLAGSYTEGAPEMEDGSYRVRATEPSRIYYFTPEDNRLILKFFPDFIFARSTLQSRSYVQNLQRARLFEIAACDRVIFVANDFPYLLRVPLEDLLEFLDLELEIDRAILEALQQKRLSPKEQLIERKN